MHTGNRNLAGIRETVGSSLGNSSRRLLAASLAAKREKNLQQKSNDMNASVGEISSLTNKQPSFTMIMENPALDALDDDSDSDENVDKRHGVSYKELSPLEPLDSHLGVNAAGLKPGKKTKGRVKIKMEFIENKLRRYTTFSKRKTGIMKKAYELSTLTGTQVMLLVASETGHVYTFATRKLQPMITSDSGKNLIQTCLNSPENGAGLITHNSLDQRMNPTGFEEMELSYSIGDEENGRINMPGDKYYNSRESGFDDTSGQLEQPGERSLQSVSSQPAFPTPYIPSTTELSNSSTNLITNAEQKTNVVPSSVALMADTSTAQTHKQTVYQLSTPGPLLSLPGQTPGLSQPLCFTTDPSQTPSSTLLSTNSGLTSGGSQTLMTPSFVMYHTPQGLMYATPTGAALPEGTIFNFQQPATALSQTENIQQGTQYITIPVPVSIAGSTQLVQLKGSVEVSDLSLPSAAKKAKK